MMNKTYLLNSSIIVSIFLFFILILPQSVFGLTNAECAESCNPYDAVSNPGSCVVTSYSCSGAVVSGTVNEGNGWCHDTYSCSGYVGSGSTFSGGYVNGTSGCTCEANGPSCQIVGSFSGGSTSGPSYQCGGGGGGGGVSCNNNGICDAGETNNSCASDCPIVGYTVSVTPLTRSILNGQSTTYFITLNPTNSTDLNNLGVYTFATPIAGCPSGATCTYSGNDTATMRESYNSLGDAFVEPTSINVTIVTSAVTPGTYPLTFSVTKNGSTAPAQSTTADLIINPGSVPTVDIKGWGNAVPQASPTDGPITMNSGTSGGLVWTSTNATNCVISRNGTNLGNFAVNSSAGVGPLTSTQTHSIVCTGPGGTSNTDSVTHTVVGTMSGSLSPTTETCIIGAGSSSCTIDFTWTTTNPVSTSVVTSDTNNTGVASPNFVVANGNNSSAPTPFTVHGSTMNRTFYLYNNGVELDQENVSASCIGGTVWNGAICNAGTPTVDIKGWGNAVPQASPTDGPITMNSGTSGGLVWTSTNATNCVISRNGTNLGNFAVNSSAGVGPLTSTQTHSIVCTGPGGTSNTDSFTHTVNAIPNLTSGAVTPITATAGTPLTFSSIITNNGSGSTGASFPNFFQVATAINGGGTITDLVSSSMPTLAAAGTNTATSPSYTFGSAGTYSVRACTDKTNSASAGVIAESNEADNCGSWTTITVSAVGATACPSGTPYISSKVLGTLRNDYSGWVGTKILIGSSSRTVTALGRIRVAGNSGTHTVKLVNVATGVDVSGGSVSVDASSGTAGQYVYTSLASPLTLAANTEYYVVSQETNGGDQWYNDTDTQVFPGSEGTIPGAVYGTTGAWNFNGVSNRSYIPVDLCTTGVITPITIGSFNPFYTSITNFPTVNNNTVYWTTTGNPTSCVASGSSPWGDGSGTSAVNASLATGSHYQGVYPGVGNYTYTLTCSKAGVSDVTAAFSVPVSAAGATQYNLTVNKTIGGSVTSIDGFISCGSTCTRAYNQGTVVTLQAVPDSVQWRFVGWGGACSGTGSCVLTVDGDKTVTAQFKPRALLYQEF